MPSKIQLDENLWFLYICLQKSDLKTINFQAVGLATSLKAPAARMRYTRLKRQIESGALLGHPFTPSPSPSLSNNSPSFSKGRSSFSKPSPPFSRNMSTVAFSGGMYAYPGKMGEVIEGKRKRSSIDDAKRENANGPGESKVKREEGVQTSTDAESGSESSSTDSDSEDEIPLAKRLKVQSHAPLTQSTVNGPHQRYQSTAMEMESRFQAGSVPGRRRQATMPVGHWMSHDARNWGTPEDRVWLGMIPTGNVGIAMPSVRRYPWSGGLGGNGYGLQGPVRSVAWEQGVQLPVQDQGPGTEVPRKSV